VKPFSDKLLSWYAQHGRRGLPWQNERDPYKVWLSEIMLQQTQVSTVKERYLQFVNTFPHLEDLAKAQIDEVMSLWAGLGYYTRARNLHACAKVIQQEYQGKFPQDIISLSQLPGIGRSTAAAIAAFCFQQKNSILDANVKRLIGRIYAVEEDFKKAATNEYLWQIAHDLLPKDARNMPAYTQALMDYGATVCTPRNPKCSGCVFKKECLAFQQDKVEKIPNKVKKVSSKEVRSVMLCVLSGDQVLLNLRPPSGIWGGLWSFPESSWSDHLEIQDLQVQTLEEFQDLPLTILRNALPKGTLLASRKHVFTHRILYFQIVILRVKHIFEIDSTRYKWVNLSGMLELGLPTPVKQFMQDYVAANSSLLQSDVTHDVVSVR
jgi:A/G-specific adenine glycosylase